MDLQRPVRFSSSLWVSLGKVPSLPRPSLQASSHALGGRGCPAPSPGERHFPCSRLQRPQSRNPPPHRLARLLTVPKRESARPHQHPCPGGAVRVQLIQRLLARRPSPSPAGQRAQACRQLCHTASGRAAVARGVWPALRLGAGWQAAAAGRLPGAPSLRGRFPSPVVRVRPTAEERPRGRRKAELGLGALRLPSAPRT